MRRNYTTIGESLWNSPFNVTVEECLFLMVNPDIITNLIVRENHQFCSQPACDSMFSGFIPWKELYRNTTTYRKDIFLICIGNFS